MLAWTIYISFIGAAVLPFLKPRHKAVARTVALAVALAGLGIGVFSVANYEMDSGLQTIVDIPWVAGMGIHYYLAADGISLTLVLLTGLASVAGILFSWNVEHRVPEFFSLYLALIGAVYGVFLSFDLFLFFVFYEIAIIPKYFLIAIWGSTRREYGAMKLALYSFVGSAMVLVGLIAAYVMTGSASFSLVELVRLRDSIPVSVQTWAFPLVFVGFAILAGLWPFHTWAPTGHVAAPTAASMLLAGVVMKLGAYGAMRVAMALFPAGMVLWQDSLAFLALTGIVFGASVALVQTDFKFVIGYSSVSHMGFVLLGLMTLNQSGLAGAVLQMFSHGIIASLLFAVVGRMVYERTHTRELSLLREMNLGKAIPFAAFTFVAAGAASMGMPGFSGFVAELQVLIGAWQAFPWFAAFAGLGIIIGVAYTLRAIQQSFYGENPVPPYDRLDSAWEGESQTSFSDGALATRAPIFGAITWPERMGAILLMSATLAIGLYPRLLTDLILSSPWLEMLAKGGRP